jgi:hypothetical protein
VTSECFRRSLPFCCRVASFLQTAISRVGVVGRRRSRSASGISHIAHANAGLGLVFSAISRTKSEPKSVRRSAFGAKHICHEMATHHSPGLLALGKIPTRNRPACPPQFRECGTKAGKWRPTRVMPAGRARQTSKTTASFGLSRVRDHPFGRPFPASSHTPQTTADRHGSYLALPRAEALGYGVLPFHGRYALRQTPNADSALTPLGKQSRWMPDYKNNHLLKSILDRPARFLLCPPRSPTL